MNGFRRDASRGYSLIELLCVLGIVSVMLGLSAQWWVSQVPRWRLQGASRQLLADLTYAKTQAVTQGNKWRIRFLDDHRYSILDDTNNNGRPDAAEPLVVRDLQIDFHDVMVTSTNHPIFHPRGTASNLATVTLSNLAGSRILTVGITGRVHLRS